MADAEIKGKAAVLARIGRIPQVVRDAAEKPLEEAVEEMASALRRNAPVAVEYEKHPGQLRESIEKYRNPDRPLSWRVIAGARDKFGRLFGRFVEFGHGNAGPRPWWFPTYRAHKKRLKTKVFTAVRKALRLLFPDTV